MKLQKFSLIIIHVGIFTSLLFGYSNCSPKKAQEGDEVQVSQSSSSSGIPADTCEGQLMQFFSTGYHKFLTQTCSTCHANGPGKGRFANPDVTIAYNDFMQVGYSKVSDNAISDGHNPPYSGSQNTQTINDLRVTWVQALAEYNTCTGGTASNIVTNVSLSDRSNYLTVDKLIPAMNEGEERKVTFDLNTEVRAIKQEPLSSLPGAKISFMIMKNHVGTMWYYTVYSPRIFNSQTDIHIKGIFTKINGRFVQSSNNFRYVDKMIPKNTIETAPESLVSTGALIIPGAISPDDQVSFSFETLEPTVIPSPPPPVTISFTSPIAQLSGSTGVVSMEVSLSAPSTEAISVTISPDSTGICGADSGTVNASNCLPQVYNLLCPPNTTCATGATNLSTARSVVGTTFNRFDWDYKMSTSSIIFAPGETKRNFQIVTSKDIRYEPNRLLTLKLEKGIGNSQLGTALSYIVFNKMKNPIPGPTEMTFSKLMNSQSGILALNCLNCHNSNPTKQQGGYDIADYEMMLAKGILIPGADFMTVNPTTGAVTKTYASKLFKRMNPQDPDVGTYLTPMPRDKYLDYDTGVSYVEKWILNGAKNN